MQATLLDEQIRIVFRPSPQAKEVRQPFRDGEWVVVPPIKPVHAGQTLVWHAIGASSFELNLPAIFEPTNPKAVPTSFGFEATARVLDDAPFNYYEYEAICDGIHAKGGSAPGVIVD